MCFRECGLFLEKAPRGSKARLPTLPRRDYPFSPHHSCARCRGARRRQLQPRIHCQRHTETGPKRSDHHPSAGKISLESIWQ